MHEFRVNKTSDAHKPRLNLTDKMNLRKGDKGVALSDICICYISKNTKKFYISTNFKISGTTWDKKLALPDESYLISDIQDYFKYIKKYETPAD